MLKNIIQLLKPHWRVFCFGLFILLVSRIAGLAVPVASKVLIDHVIIGKQQDLLPAIIIFILAASSVQAVSSLFLRRNLSFTAHDLIKKLRKRLQAHVQSLPLSFYDSTQSGKLVSKIIKDPESIRDLFGGGLIEMVGGITTSLLSVSLMLYISPKMTFAMLFSIVVFVGILIKYLLSATSLHKEGAKVRAETQGRLTESVSAIRVVKSYNAEKHEEAAFENYTEKMRQISRKSVWGYGVMSAAVVLLIGCVTSGILYLGTIEITSGAMTIGSLFFYVTLLGFLIAPLIMLVEVGSSLNEAVANLDHCYELLDEKPENGEDRTVHLGKISGSVKFENVCFEYTKDKAILSNIYINAEPGTVTAFVGPSGAGKSTIINLLAGFYKPKEGRITIDNHDLDFVKLETFRSNLGIVLQDTFLFDGTIRENVAFSRPDATEEEIIAACKTANVEEFVEKLPDKYDTIVGERGVKLSGGQKQRISIARAVLANPKILILDEATSSLDSESEMLVQVGLQRTMKGRTTFLIAHRLSTVKNANQILVINDGKIIEQGSHEELINKRGQYHQMWQQQIGSVEGIS